jgi:4-carboxymuconolactone decarboxylase
VSDGHWTGLAAHWNDAQLVELLLLVGWYHAISYVANGARVEAEPWAARFPASA